MHLPLSSSTTCHSISAALHIKCHTKEVYESGVIQFGGKVNESVTRMPATARHSSPGEMTRVGAAHLNSSRSWEFLSCKICSDKDILECNSSCSVKTRIAVHYLYYSLQLVSSCRIFMKAKQQTKHSNSIHLCLFCSRMKIYNTRPITEIQFNI